ncbi:MULTISPECIES: indolepyruvate ferredoxin oxidoreductase family protein [Comamonas]|uniref:indolepyruvate ferredoxin oxidoreductase family protein n=1 Tax=Comamonas TaxID=283 RepID=UPI0021135F11|nr:MULTISPECIES: indolepyruvate ferredoxin oxidoreductase family protein [Comamonas]UUC95038.1 indolepyruvate ferredoxin oxidoreductase family protein [Comamonas sp. C11]WEE79075.1 indolepyruvate ferredoxin oxidoreductase family protein [Comamonas testosteroni]
MTNALPSPIPGDTPRLDDRYTKTTGTVFLSGNQALVRLAIQQRLIDQAAGLNTGGYISGYRGSPLGRYDMELWSAGSHLERWNIKFQPGVNEDMAATAVWGTQSVGLVPGAQVDGVFGMWYGKGPGVDRSGDVFKHANLAGTSPSGGVLVLAGDDHGSKSSTTAHQSEPALMAAGIPVLAPSNVQEIIDYGLHGIAMSRFSGCWVSLKLVTDVVESSSTVNIDPALFQSVLPPLPPVPGGVSIRLHDRPQMQEARLYGAKLPLSVAYARAKHLNRVTHDVPNARVGIVAAGKAYADTLQALQELGLTNEACKAVGIRVLKLGMVFPLDPEAVLKFSDGLQAILVVEEKRPLIEQQLKAVLYDAALANPPKIIGKPALPSVGELAPNIVAHAIAKLLGQDEMAQAIPLSPTPKFGPDGQLILGPMRLPTFCSGCPHNSSTKLPDGSRALAGIGCHTIAMLTSPQNTMTVSHMGGEGMLWAGQAPFTAEKHVFANMGDGTYFHSGLLAIRSAVASKVNITYKLLVNGFVSMTGGQPVDGEISVPQMVQQLKAEGVRHIVVTTEDLERVQALGLPSDVPVHHRRELDRVQRELREMHGTTVLIHDQACATERRRLRKRGKWADPKVRTFIHPEICEGCGDCGAKSGCLSIEPLETPLGRKRRINQSSCNKDYACVEGFCPSFVTVHGAEPKKAGMAKRAQPMLDESTLPLPSTALQRDSLGVLITGIGGTGVVTVGAIISMAAYLDGLACSTLDITGLAQKYGAVMTHMRIARDPLLLTSARLAMGEADVVVGCDLLVTAGDESLSLLRPATARLVVNSEQVPTTEFSRDPDWQFDAATLTGRLQAAAADRFELIDATVLAKELLGDAVFGNMLMLGVAWQRGMIPVSLDALKKAIELNGVQVARNVEAFNWGRLWAADPQRLASLQAQARPAHVIALPTVESLDAIVRDRMQRLTGYQNAALAKTYGDRISRLRQAAQHAGTADALVKTAARQYYRLLAHKDEYEVGRLYSDPAFHKMLQSEFDGDLKVHWHLGGGPLAKKDARTGQAVKTEKVFAMPLILSLLGRLRIIRGSWLDPFRNSEERRLASRLRAQYEADLDHIQHALSADNAKAMTRLAGWPAQVRGYGHVREASAMKALAAREELRQPAPAAAEPAQQAA